MGPGEAAMTASNTTEKQRSFEEILAEDGHEKPRNFDWTMNYMFRGVSLKAKTVLDVGSGRGLTPIWISRQGAKQVYSMEPELAGSRSGVISVQEARIRELGLDNIHFVSDEFEKYDPGETRFDVILSKASINHLEESEYHALFHQPTYDAFLRIAVRFRELLRPGGVVVATDAARYGFFAAAKTLGLPNRYCYARRNINFRIHQNPATWKKIFKAAGFSRVQVDYPMPFALRHLRPALNNPVSNFFLQSAFILRAWA